MKSEDSATKQIAQAMDGGWGAGGQFFGSIMSGFLIGYLLDRWLGTDPWLVVIGIALGSYSGFMRLWAYAKKEMQPRER